MWTQKMFPEKFPQDNGVEKILNSIIDWNYLPRLLLPTEKQIWTAELP